MDISDRPPLPKALLLSTPVSGELFPEESAISAPGGTTHPLLHPFVFFHRAKPETEN
jgi:hypothetical protein